MTPAAHWSPADGMAAVERARRAWARSQPQLVIDGWADMLDDLDSREGEARSTRAAAFPRVEAAAFPPRGGLAPTFDGPDASCVLGARRGREGA